MSRRTRREDECSRKQQHTSRRMAQDHLFRLRVASGVTAPERLHVYSCPFSAPGERHYHVGHRTLKEQDRMEKEGLL